ncbi:hypothetical protein NL676_039894 [Syzygium grande]|nr:hypothetical protein NL676_039894 [Syzygium grande]
MKSENIRLEDELRKSRDECLAAKRSRLAEDVYSTLTGRVRRGGGETSSKEIFDNLRRRNGELEGEKRELESKLRVMGNKYKDFDQRLLQLEKEMKCT